MARSAFSGFPEEAFEKTSLAHTEIDINRAYGGNSAISELL
jgi:hypothetical protein